MGLRTKQVSSDDALNWGQPLQLQEQQSTPLKCPRCDSTNTKFCYYNNYNRSQPRHYCKSCKRHWTKGGTLRNVPIGGERKNKRLKISSTNTNLEIRPLQHYQPSSKFESNDNSFVGSTLSLLPPSNFPFTILSNFNNNSSLFSGSFQSSNGYNYTGENEAVEEPIMATSAASAMAGTTTSLTSSWQMPSTSISMNSSSYWNWDELTSFIPGDVKQIWDETQQ